MKTYIRLSLAYLVSISLIGCNLTALTKNDQSKNDKTKNEQKSIQPQVIERPENNAKDEHLYSTYELGKGSDVKEKTQNSIRQNRLEGQAKHKSSKNQAVDDSKKMPARPQTPATSGGAVSDHYDMDESYETEYYAPVTQEPIYDPIIQNTESYNSIVENKFFQCREEPLSTFSIDVDTASYSNVRRFLKQGQMPPADAVRIEEMVNYFDYEYEAPKKDAFAVNLEMGPALWNKKHQLVRIGIKGHEMKTDKRPASNLVFLVDVSGSMEDANKLPLVKSALAMLVDKLNKNDKISMVVYAGNAGLVLQPTTGDNKFEILRAIDNLSAGGSTNGGQGIELAYKMASEAFIKGGVNRLILATDGDFNVGTTSREGLLELVEKNAKKNIYLSILGFGMGNYKDGMMETLSNKGNGNYAYIDSQQEARKVLVEQMSGTLVTIAKDVKLQVEFNPQFVQSYRLVGYENRVLKHEDFNNDKKDAGDIGAGHTVTALYEIIPVGVKHEGDTSIDPLKYQQPKKSFTDKIKEFVSTDSSSNELLTVKIRYKKPDGDVSTKLEFPLKNKETSLSSTSDSYRFASAVALFGMLLRNSNHVQNGTYADVLSVAKESKGSDKNGYRAEFIELVKTIKTQVVSSVTTEE